MTDAAFERTTPLPAPTDAGVALASVVATLREHGFDVGVSDALEPELSTVRVRSLAFHTGRVTPGTLFAALPGARSHGLDHAVAAFDAGAVAVLSDRPHPRGLRVADPAEAVLALGRAARADWRGPVVGISGSAGKTTTRALAAAALDAHATDGNYNTPLALAATMAAGLWSGRGDDAMVLELGIDRAGEMDELVDLTRPDVGLLTLIAASHLEALGDVATVAREKGRLLARAATRIASRAAADHLAPELRVGLHTYALLDAQERARPADARGVGPGRDPQREDPRPEPVLTGRLVDPGAARHEATPGATRPTIGQTLRVRGHDVALPFRGRALAENALGALAAALAVGVDLGDACARLERVRLEPGRLELRPWGDADAGWILDDSYNSSPAAAAEALTELRRLPGPRTAVLGAMLELGAESDRYHEDLGRRTVGLDRVVAVGEAARPILAGNPRATWVADRHAALAAVRDLEPRGTLLVKGSRGIGLELVADALAGARA